MRVDLTVESVPGRHLDVALVAARDVRLGQLLAPLRAMTGASPTTAVWVDAVPVHDDSRVGHEPLLPGAVLRFGSRPTPGRARSSMLELRVVGGPDAGLCVDLPIGHITVGRAPACDLVLTDPDVSRAHARVTTTRETVWVEELSATNGTTIDGGRVPGDGASLRFGQIMRIGDSFLALAGPAEPPSRTVVRNGRIEITRRWRGPQSTWDAGIELPPEPRPHDRTATGLTPAAIALTGGVTIALVIRNMQLLVLGIVMPLSALLVSIADLLRRRRRTKRAMSVYRDELATVEQTVCAALRDEAEALRSDCPDVAALHRIATVRTARLWERLRSDLGLLTIRVGTGTRTSQVPISCDAKPAPRPVESVPVTVNLADGPIGVDGPTAAVARLISYVLCQLAVLCSPSDVELIGVFTPATERRWRWLRWFPHVRRPPATSMTAQEGLAGYLAERLSQRGRDGGRDPDGDWLVLLLDVADGEVHSGISAALRQSAPGARITAIVISAPRKVHCVATVTFDGETGTRLLIRTAHTQFGAVADLIRAPTAHGIARALAPLVDQAAGHETTVGDDRSLLALLDLPPTPTSSDIVARWRTSDGMPSTPIGTGAAGRVHVDLVIDGPHALIAGTTGSGKSECLQALVAGLAARHPPDEVAFILVDYKGGAAFAGCAQLPHVAGLVTDLDPVLTARALRALNREVRHRELLFAEHHVANLEHYRSTAQASSPLPRLIMVIDEFAALAEDAPELLRGLVDVAQRGRSLGVHLVLATQRPAGIVSPEIRANASMRIALRVTDPTESIDIVGTDAAAFIDPTKPGAAILNRAGGSALLRIARVSGRSATRSATPAVHPLQPWRVLADSGQPTKAAGDDLTVLVDAIGSAAQATSCNAASAPWLPPLPVALDAADLPKSSRPERVHIGLIDLPDERAQPPVVVDLREGGTIVICGTARTGKTTAARTIALRSAAGAAPTPLRTILIGLDLARDSHLAASRLLDVARFDAVAETITALRAELAQRGRDSPMQTLLVVDGWEDFASASEARDFGRTAETLLDIARQAHTARCTVVITGDRAVLNPRVAGIAQSLYVLKLRDRADYGLAGIPRSAVPAQMSPGRALLAPDGHPVQFGQVPTRLSSCAGTGGPSAARTSP